MVLTNQALASDALTPLIVHEISRQPVSLIGAPSLVGSMRTVRDLLAAHPVILPMLDSSVRIGFNALADRLGIQPQIAAEVDDMAMMRLLVREGFALAILPPIAVRDELASGILVEAETLPGIDETFFAITAERRFPNLIARALIQGTPAW